MPELVELRCPSNLRHLFMKMTVTGERPKYTEENWIEVACGDCKSEQRKLEMRNLGSTSIIRVLHYFSFMGELMKTEIVRLGGDYIQGS